MCLHGCFFCSGIAVSMVMKYADNIVKVRLGFMTGLWYSYDLIASIEFEIFMSSIKIMGYFIIGIV